MNAEQCGQRDGFAEALSRIQPDKEQFEKIAWWLATHTYKRREKQDEYYQGFMKNWHEPHPESCTCSTCKAKPEVLTY